MPLCTVTSPTSHCKHHIVNDDSIGDEDDSIGDETPSVTIPSVIKAISNENVVDERHVANVRAPLRHAKFDAIRFVGAGQAENKLFYPQRADGLWAKTTGLRSARAWIRLSART